MKRNKRCTLCGSTLIPLGTLGNRHHYRCRNCGMEFSKAKRQHNRPARLERT